MKRMIAGLVPALAFALTACGGGQPSVEVNEENCIDEEGRNICEAMGQEQIVADTTFIADFTEVIDSNGDPVGTLTSGTDVQVVCATSDSNHPEYGIILTSEIVNGPTDDPRGFADPDRFATGLIDGENFASVGFVLAEYVEDGESIKDDLESQLEERFPELSAYSCDDNRVVVTTTGKKVMTAQ